MSDKWLSRPIEDGHFKIVNFDENVVHPAGIDRGKKMLGRREEYALLHQAGGVADARDVPDMRFDPEAIKIGPAEHDSSSSRRRNQPQMRLNCGMKPDTCRLDRPDNRVLEGHFEGRDY